MANSWLDSDFFEKIFRAKEPRKFLEHNFTKDADWDLAKNTDSVFFVKIYFVTKFLQTISKFLQLRLGFPVMIPLEASLKLPALFVRQMHIFSCHWIFPKTWNKNWLCVKIFKHLDSRRFQLQMNVKSYKFLLNFT